MVTGTPWQLELKTEYKIRKLICPSQTALWKKWSWLESCSGPCTKALLNLGTYLSDSLRQVRIQCQWNQMHLFWNIISCSFRLRQRLIDVCKQLKILDEPCYSSDVGRRPSTLQLDGRQESCNPRRLIHCHTIGDLTTMDKYPKKGPVQTTLTV